MITVGVDLAAEPKKTAIAFVTWADCAAAVTALHVGVDNDTIVRLARQADKVGIDCPLGWPVQFVEFISSHCHGQVVVPAGEPKKWRRALAWRVTDEDIRRKTKLIPLSVAADRIGHAAMRCAALLAELADAGLPVDRAGTGVVVEVYPAASMRRWDITSTGYKGSNGKAAPARTPRRPRRARPAGADNRRSRSPAQRWRRPVHVPEYAKRRMDLSSRVEDDYRTGRGPLARGG